MSQSLKRSKLYEQDDHWIPLSDLMTGLMMMFLLVAIMYMVKVEADAKLIREASERTKKIALLYQNTKSELYEDLQKEFAADLPKWDAEVLPGPVIRFKSPEILFDVGKANLKQKFKDILEDFFPRYVAILTSKKYKDSIEEVRVEGHTSSLWQSSPSYEYSYFQNLALSQDRTRSTLQYVMTLPAVNQEVPWLLRRVTANGLSYSHLLFGPNGKEDTVRSQRVEFRVKTDAEAKLEKILETIK